MANTKFTKFTNPRVLHTNFYSLEFKLLLDQFFYRLASSNKKCLRRDGEMAATEIAPDGEVLINFNVKANDWYKTTYAKKQTDNAILDWIGWMMKVQTHEMLERRWKSFLPNGVQPLTLDKYDADDRKMIVDAKKAAKKAEWKRNSSCQVTTLCIIKQTLDVEVKDIYFIYDALKNRKGCDRRYDEAIVKKWRGQQKDPLATEMEVARRAEAERINDEYNRMIEDWDPNYHYNFCNRPQSKAYNELQRIIAEFKSKCEAEQERLKAERDEKLKELDAMCCAAI